MTQGSREHRGLYRARDGMVFGVCKGVAQYLDISVFWIRILALIFLFCSCGWALLVYFMMALLMKLEPVIPFDSEQEEEFYQSYASSRARAIHRLKRTYDNLDRRIQRMESVVTAREYDWDQRLHE